MNVGERIRAAREELGMQRTVLARRLGVAPNTVWRYESGEREPSMAMLEKIAAELRTEPAELLREPELVGKAEARETGRPEEEAEVHRLEIPYMARPRVRDWLAANGHMSREDFLSWVGKLEGVQGIEDARAELREQRNRLLRALKAPATRKALFPIPIEAELSREESRNWLLKPPSRRELEQEIRREYSAREIALVNYSRWLFVAGEAEDYLVYAPVGERDHARHEELLRERRKRLEEAADDAGVA